MKMLKILQKLQYNAYILEEKETKKHYELSLEFYDGVNAEVGDYLLLDERLLDSTYEGYSMPYAFGKCGETEKFVKTNPDYAVLHKDKINITLKRLYG